MRRSYAPQLDLSPNERLDAPPASLSNAYMTARKPIPRSPSRLLRLAHLHGRLIACAGIGAGAFAVLPGEWPLSTRILVAWNVGVGLYLILAGVMMARYADIDQIRERAAAQDEGAGFVLLLTAGAAFASLGAIFAELGSAAKADPEHHLHHIALAVATILLSWVFTHLIFAQHYAYEYYGRGGERGGGLKFPGSGAPDYSDFVYFSLVIGMTSQVSDVAVTSRAIRRTVSAHGVFSFLFNTTIIALTVNIGASVMGGSS